ncbi:MAG: DUF3990 domain-containing protein [Clostridia bacterium]|nr:DUF3990 domain-containing protein [Clostridia bacterium]
MNKLKDGMLLFHGSYTTVREIKLEKCSNAKDFGKGFYLLSSLAQARAFIHSSLRKALNAGDIAADQNHGYVSSFRYHEPADGIEVYEFPTTNRDWLWFVAQNRRERLAKQLRDKIDPQIFRAEITVGKVANDNTNATIAAYVGGLYGKIESEEAVNDAIKRLMPDKLEDQFCFLTERAISCLEFQEARKYVV